MADAAYISFPRFATGGGSNSYTYAKIRAHSETEHMTLAARTPAGSTNSYHGRIWVSAARRERLAGRTVDAGRWTLDAGRWLDGTVRSARTKKPVFADLVAAGSGGDLDCRP